MPLTPCDGQAQIHTMTGGSDQRQGTLDGLGSVTAEDVEAEERATDEGMPEAPGSATSDGMGTHVEPPQTSAAPPDATRGEPLTVDEREEGEEDDGGYDLGGEG
jgi:hypothetical protein